MTLRHVVWLELMSAAGLTALLVYSVEGRGTSRFAYLLIPLFWALALGTGYLLSKLARATEQRDA